MVHRVKILSLILLLCIFQGLFLSCNSSFFEESVSSDRPYERIGEKVNFPLALGNQWIYRNFQVWIDESTGRPDTSIEYDTLSISGNFNDGQGHWWFFSTKPESWRPDWNTLVERNDSLFGLVTGFSALRQHTEKIRRIRRASVPDCGPGILRYLTVPWYDTVYFGDCYTPDESAGFRLSEIFPTPAGDFANCLAFCGLIIFEPTVYPTSRSHSSVTGGHIFVPDGYYLSDIIKPGIGIVGFEHFWSDDYDTLSPNLLQIEVHLRLQSYSLH